MYKNVFLDLPFISSFGDGIGFMVSVLDSGANIRGLSPGWEHCVMFFSKTLYSNGNLSPPRCINGILQIYCWGGTLQWTSITSRGE